MALTNRGVYRPAISLRAPENTSHLLSCVPYTLGICEWHLQWLHARRSGQSLSASGDDYLDTSTRMHTYQPDGAHTYGSALAREYAIHQSLGDVQTRNAHLASTHDGSPECRTELAVGLCEPSGPAQGASGNTCSGSPIPPNAHTADRPVASRGTQSARVRKPPSGSLCLTSHSPA